ncbi:hsp70/Hsp90 co-chaperone Cns1p [[Candida] jaroonii]|uniref:Hsp70/Hsp90 co-chaperone Cns1p n=1 Tax=[Candida] jaroonii TaxID=467808 RepID=A0ACA9YFB4_9ASCO|nr:hsp70/Hsp90 co-chaperone Cns1p [[Candida] jaroonii]
MTEPQSEWDKRRYIPKPGEPDLPPQLTEYADKSSTDIMKDLNRLPFFMTELDETDGEGGENSNLEALRSLAYEGEPHEIAGNFKNQGNDHFKGKNYKTAVEFYTKGLDVECDDDSINLALYLNRAACNLELKNYRRCIEDCKKALVIDPKSVKACYRSGKAFYLVNRLDEAKQILDYGLSIDGDNKPIQETLQKVTQKQAQVQLALERKEREQKEKELKNTILVNAIKLRHFLILKSKTPTELLEEAKIRLENDVDYESQLIFPAMILYPTTDEFDYLQEVGELTTPNEILNTVMQRPQSFFEDPKHKNFAIPNLQCFLETEAGGLVKVGKNVAINEVLMKDSPKTPLFDNALRLYVVPKQESAEWISKWNKEAVLAKRLL